MQDIELFTVGFFSSSEPGVAQTWRPKENSREAVPREKANKRFEKLVKAMKKGKLVDGLLIESVWIRDAAGGAIRSMTKDGTEAEPKPGDAARFLMLTKPVRASC